MESTKSLKVIRLREWSFVKFPSVKAAKDWIYSEAYQNVAKHRKHGAIYHGLIVEGVS
jgi:uncharacterized protein (DUF1330 family)